MGATGIYRPYASRAHEVDEVVDTGALASVMIVLVFTLLFATWLAPTHHGIGADLPKVSHPVPMPGSEREDSIIITIMRDGSIYFGADKVRPSQVQSKILDRLKDLGVERKVYIRADLRVWFYTVKQVLDAVRSAGVERVAFLVDQRRSLVAAR